MRRNLSGVVLLGWGDQGWGSDPWGSSSDVPPTPTPTGAVSTYTVDGEVSGTASPGAVSTTEAFLDSQLYNVVVNWDALPGTEFKAGVSGRFTIGSNPVILRVRYGARPNLNNSGTAPVGSVAFSVTLPANTTTDLGAFGDLVTKPSGATNHSVLQLTVQASGGASTIAAIGAVMKVTPGDDGAGMGIMLSSGRPSTGTLVETVAPGNGYEWIVDFDQFEGAVNLLFGFAVYEDPMFGGNTLTVRVRVGGTDYTVDGTVVLAVTDPNSSQAPFEWIVAGEATVANSFVGAQLVKISWDGRAGPGRPTLIIREAA